MFKDIIHNIFVDIYVSSNKREFKLSQVKRMVMVLIEIILSSYIFYKYNFILKKDVYFILLLIVGLILSSYGAICSICWFYVFFNRPSKEIGSKGYWGYFRGHGVKSIFLAVEKNGYSISLSLISFICSYASATILMCYVSFIYYYCYDENMLPFDVKKGEVFSSRDALSGVLSYVAFMSFFDTKFIDFRLDTYAAYLWFFFIQSIRSVFFVVFGPILVANWKKISESIVKGSGQS